MTKAELLQTLEAYHLVANQPKLKNIRSALEQELAEADAKAAEALAPKKAPVAKPKLVAPDIDRRV